MGAQAQDQAKEGQSVVEFSDKKKFNFTPLSVWGGFALAVLFMVYLLVAKSGLSSTIADLETQRTDIQSQLESPSYVDTEKQILAASSAVNTLTEIKDKEISKKTLLDEIYSHITNDVKITSIAVGSDGSLAVDGATGSYRSVADLIMALKSYERVSDLKLASVAVSDEEGISAKEKVVFTITAKIDLTKEITSDTGVDSSPEALGDNL
jgi:Tfp pilus assembly protein PilN